MTHRTHHKSVPAQDQTRRHVAYSAFITTYRNPRNPPAEQGRARQNSSYDAKESTKKYILGSCNLVHPVTHIHNLRIIKRQAIHLSSKSTTQGYNHHSVGYTKPVVFVPLHLESFNLNQEVRNDSALFSANVVVGIEFGT